MTKKRKILLILNYSFWLCILFLPFSSFAQEHTVIKGVVADSLESNVLDSCMVTIRAGKTEQHTFTNSKGLFNFRLASTSDTIDLLFQHKNYREYTTRITGINEIRLDTIFLVPDAKLMEEILVRSRIPAIVQKNDTTEYMVDSFDHPKASMIGELLKDLPGIQILDDGTITHNGKPITEITVNGQTFYDSKGDIALSNLPAGIVKKIQVMDQKTQEQVLNDMLGGGDTKKLNIQLKSGSHVFGNAVTGGSTRNSYNGNVMGNELNDLRQLSAMGGMMNNKTQGFDDTRPSLESIMKNAGGHFSDKIKKSFSYNGNFTVGSTNTAQESKTQVQQFIKTDSSFITNTTSFSDSKNSNYQGAAAANWSTDKLYANLNVSLSGSKNSSAFNSASSILENGLMKNENVRNGSTDGKSSNIMASLLLNKKFKKKGRNLSVTFRLSNNDNSSDGLNYSDIALYNAGIFSKRDILRQHIISTGNATGSGISASFTESITKNLRLMLSNSLDITRSENQRAVFNIDSITKTDKYDSVYSSRWTSNNSRNTTNMSLMYDLPNLSLSVGFAAYRNLSERLMESKENIVQDQFNYSPSVMANYRISKTKSLGFRFSANTQNPTIDQLQPVPNNSNPLLVFIGNPNLRSSFQQSYSLNYSANYSKGSYGSWSLAYSPTANSIVAASFYDVYRKRILQYINVDGIYSLRGSWSYWHTLDNSKSKAGSSLSANGGIDYGRNVYFDNSSMLYTRTYAINQSINYGRMMTGNKRTRLNASAAINYKRTVSPSDKAGINSENFNLTSRIEYGFSIKSFVDLSISYNGSYNSVSYNPLTGSHLNYMMHTIINTTSFQLSKKSGVSSLVNYNYNGRVPANVKRGTFFWTVSAFTRVFKDHSGQFNFSAIDILNSSRNYNSFLGENYISDMITAKQRNYFTLSFQYNWMKKEKKKEKE